MNTMSRRSFILSSAATLTAAASARAAGSNDRIGLGVIGCGSMGRGDVRMFMECGGVDVRVICDVDDHNSSMLRDDLDRSLGIKPGVVRDFRKVLDRGDVDLVLIATPDHWHALPAVQACQAGKDIYLEKPFANSIGESRAIVKAAEKYKRIIQMGSQWRSWQYVKDARDFVASGKIGKVRLVRAWAYQAGRADSPDFVPVAGPPASADYDLWLGPAPSHAWDKNRFHRSWRYFWEYGGGNASDNGVHLIGIGLWPMGNQAPLRVSSSGGKYSYDDSTETPDTQITTVTFPDYTLVWEHAQRMGLGFKGASIGVEWIGTKGTVTLDEYGWRTVPEPEFKAFEPEEHRPSTENPRVAHGKELIACMSSREQPVYHPEEAHYVTTVSHLGNLAYRTGAEVQWDNAAERIPNNASADELLMPEYRSPWTLDGI